MSPEAAAFWSGELRLVWPARGDGLKILLFGANFMTEMTTVQSAKMECGDMIGRGCAVQVHWFRDHFSLAALWVALLAGFVPLTVFPQSSATNEPSSDLPPSSAFQELTQRATGGDPKAEHDLGMIYAEGNGVPQDFAKSVTWFRKAAEQDYADAQLRLGMSYLEGKGIEVLEK
jgi:TPR repeat protein